MTTFKIKNIKLALVLAGVLGFSSCGKDFLDQANPNAITPDNFWKTDQDAIKGVNSVYNILYYNGIYHRWLHFIDVLRSDVARSVGPWDQIQDIAVFTMTSAKNGQNINSVWADHYQGINRANQVILNVTGNEAVSQAVKDQVLGQAYFLRGLLYFNLVKYYENIPLILKPAESSEDYFNQQANPAQIWEQIHTDWKNAAELLPVSWDEKNKGRATKGAAVGFLAKAYLMNKNYSEAATLFESLIHGSYNYQLVPNYGDNFNETAPKNNAESIFEIQYSSKTGGSVFQDPFSGEPSADEMLSNFRAQCFGPAGFGWGDVAVNKWLVDEFMAEKTVNGAVDPRLEFTVWYNHPGETIYGIPFEQAIPEGNRSNAYAKKYQHWRSKSGFNSELDRTTDINHILMRYADVLLMYAECLNELGRTQEAYQYIQQVRSRANLPDLATVKPNMNQEQMREQIAHERLLELALEGFRFDDLVRWGWLQKPEKLDLLKKHDGEFSTYRLGRERLPIPQRELDISGYPQNPGY